MLGRPLYGCDDSILAWLPELGTLLVLETKRIVTFFGTWLFFFFFPALLGSSWKILGFGVSLTWIGILIPTLPRWLTG